MLARSESRSRDRLNFRSQKNRTREPKIRDEPHWARSRQPPPPALLFGGDHGFAIARGRCPSVPVRLAFNVSANLLECAWRGPRGAVAPPRHSGWQYLQ